MYSNVKFLSATKFTAEEDDPYLLIDNNLYLPRILIATASCIGNGLDLDIVYKVVHIGFPQSIVDAVKEMGRCRRKKDDQTNHTPDLYTLMVNIHNVFILTKDYTQI